VRGFWVGTLVARLVYRVWGIPGKMAGFGPVTASHVLITGADGYLGSLVARLYLKQSSDPLFLGVRATDAAELSSKKEK
jgi:hypothetical protein